MFLQILGMFALHVIVFFVARFLCILSNNAEFAVVFTILYVLGLFSIGFYKGIWIKEHYYQLKRIKRMSLVVIFSIAYIVSSIFFIYTLFNLNLPVWDTEYEYSDEAIEEYGLTSIKSRQENKDNEEIFLLVGSDSDGNAVYTYYSVSENGAYKEEELVYSDVRIKEDSSDTPKLIKYAQRKNKKVFKNGEFVETRQGKIDDDPESIRYEFVVPEGTVIYEKSSD